MPKKLKKSIPAPEINREPTHPGAIIASAMRALRTNANAVSKAIGMTPTALGNVLSGRSRLTPEMALLLDRHLRGPRGERVDATLLMALQAQHDFWRAHQDPVFANKLAAVGRLDA